MYQTYTVKQGDTLYGISNQFGVNVNALAELNNIRGSNLQIGQVLKIPNISGNNPSNMFIYTVKKGDSLYSIAVRYNTTVKAIQELNYLKNINLQIGQQLRIPEVYNESEISLPNYINYVVKKGDSLYSIARNSNIAVDILMKDNNLSNTNLSIGQTLRLRVPVTEHLEVEAECIGPDYIPKESENIVNYVVKKGDNLYSIARQFNTSENVITNLNNLKSTTLTIGQVLKIPSMSKINGSSETLYTVKSGDSLYAIAKKFNTTIDSIKKKNNLTSNLLSIGQKLKI